MEQPAPTTALIPFAWLGHRQADGVRRPSTGDTPMPKLTMTVAARTVGGQARRPETSLANKKQI